MFEPLSVKKRALIIDTDIGPDCDDVGALAVAFQLQKKYGFSIPAVINCTSNPYGCGAVDAIACFNKAPELAVGYYRDHAFLDDCMAFNKEVAQTFSPAYRDGSLKLYDSTLLYKKVLEEAEDDGVILATIGQFNALCDAMKAYPTLFQTKVHAMVSMAGQYPEGEREYNVFCDAEAAQYVFSHATFPVIFSGFEIGFSFKTGFMPEDNLPDNPLWVAYNRYTKGVNRRESWDLTCIQIAIEGTGDYYTLSEPVTVEVREDGSEIITPDEKGNCRFACLATGRREALASYLSGIVTSVK